jgi:hypothetical protein
MSRCKAAEIPWNGGVLMYVEMTRDEANTADGRFSSACHI